MKSTVDINGVPTKPENRELRLPEVWFDPQLKWDAQIAKAEAKGRAAMAAMGRIVGVNWGPSFRRSRLVYTAVVRPAMLYGIQTWGSNDIQGAVS